MISQKAIELEKEKNERLKRKAQEDKAREAAGVAPAGSVKEKRRAAE